MLVICFFSNLLFLLSSLNCRESEAWHSNSTEPHSNFDELCHALALETSGGQQAADRYPFNGIMPFHGSTVQITLSTPHEPPPRSSRVHGIPHSKIAKICLNFPNSRQAKSSPNRSRPRSPTRTLSRSPTHPSRPPTDTVSQLFFSISGNLHKTGPLRLCETAFSEVI